MVTARKKVAVVLIHGIGEQIPMQTVEGFVQAAWVENGEAHWTPPGDENAADIWYKPDPLTGSRELRRITTRWTKSKVSSSAKGPRIDFFELYWADLAAGPTAEEVWDWLRTLLWRPWSQVPHGLKGAWILLWTTTLFIGGLSLAAVMPWPGAWLHFGLVILAGGVALGMQYVVAPYAGRVARYVRADPRNIAIRAAIRDRGLKLLRDLHDRGSYERIVFVAHSLGAVIAYDLVSLLWAERSETLVIHEDEPAFAKLRALEAAAHLLERAPREDLERRRSDYRDAQRAFRLALRSGGEDGTHRQRKPDEEWLISDLVTLGSPLVHAQFLVARDQADLAYKIKRWLFPTNWPQFQRIESEQRDKINDRPQPPSTEVLGPEGGLFSYFRGPSGTWSMHHSAPFAAVRWTNVYDPHRCIFKGDIISGPAAPVFGDGILDVDLREVRGKSPGFTHTLYWSLQPENAKVIKVLQKAIDLTDRPDGEIWTKRASV